ncbi:hypothetical protein [Phaeodactylibacter sp.]|uniref:hypothetical protein n=1 Tax=Phaeodactylibacter sp. TaxID=1940289 RepID=UPI0025E83F65|nr:hypothetical protein [Phaeodactylibacter sp.]MCI5091625.1 hypothetical protein [Phaeodactylibacter sp.]
METNEENNKGLKETHIKGRYDIVGILLGILLTYFLYTLIPELTGGTSSRQNTRDQQELESKDSVRKGMETFKRKSGVHSDKKDSGSEKIEQNFQDKSQNIIELKLLDINNRKIESYNIISTSCNESDVTKTGSSIRFPCNIAHGESFAITVSVDGIPEPLSISKVYMGDNSFEVRLPIEVDTK